MLRVNLKATFLPMLRQKDSIVNSETHVKHTNRIQGGNYTYIKGWWSICIRSVPPYVILFLFIGLHRANHKYENGTDMGSFFHQAMNKIDTQVHFHAAIRRFTNDPSAGSPTETLLRLLLPSTSTLPSKRFHSAKTLRLHMCVYRKMQWNPSLRRLCQELCGGDGFW